METPGTYSQFTTYACADAVAILTCPAGRNINVTRATYGVNGLSCFPCCPPNPIQDCKIDIESERPIIWDVLEEECNGLNSCSFENLAASVSECGVGENLDYIQIFYDCSLSDATGPVGFTALLLEDEVQDIEAGAVVPFAGISSNIGGHFDVKSHSFVCPFSGMYLFIVSVVTYDSNVFASLVQNDRSVVSVIPDNPSSNDADSATTSLVTECSPGDVVWVYALSGGQYYNGLGSYVNSFSGYLLHRF